MEEKIETLFALLEQELEFYENLVDISDEEQKSIISGKIEEIEKLTKEKEKILLEITKLEKARVLVVEDLSKILNVPSSDLNLTKLREFLSPSDSLKLNNIQDRFEKVVLKLKNITENNADLIKTSLDYIQFSLNLLSSSVSSGTYKDTRNVKEDTPQVKILDKKA